ncbi:TPA: segregation/condensation protein B [Candidatus Nomurabacteria bacterium]|nr:segregation/condensation protein B [Candidatus Nomurabacteria bacterium]HBB54316.1 segregation/condensation protein B [Candidatus Nomurabacteria bacterium]HCC67057.1 segregation/condensation protein B [Candidatus Nomurabacteria bacterium]HCW88272.1 segregation/condensation protein B [Candidatus Nomurabacteria bacterium]
MRPRKCTREILLLVKIMSNLQNKIEAILFWKGEPMSRKRLAEILSSSAKASDGQGRIGQLEINEAIEKLKENLKNRGIVLIEKDDEITLGTAPELSPLIEKLQKEELNKELSKASLETLSIILYKNGISRSEIDYIRGVNSSFILRALSVRGLVERETDPKDNRRYIYKPSFELMSYMGIKSLEELPDWAEVNGSIEIAAKNLEEESKEEN